MPYLPCEDEQILKFNLRFVACFDDHPNDPIMNVYSDDLQVLLKQSGQNDQVLTFNQSADANR